MSKYKTISIHESSDEMELDRYRHGASVAPIQGLGEPVELILRASGTSREDLKERNQHHRITFTKIE